MGVFKLKEMMMTGNKKSSAVLAEKKKRKDVDAALINAPIFSVECFYKIKNIVLDESIAKRLNRKNAN